MYVQVERGAGGDQHKDVIEENGGLPPGLCKQISACVLDVAFTFYVLDKIYGKSKDEILRAKFFGEIQMKLFASYLIRGYPAEPP